MKDVHVTLYDVAARAGVSASTASRALAGLAVNKANRAAVEKAAADLGYIPNEAARSLRVVRTMTVGMVFNQLTSQLGMELLGALTSSLDKMGYSLFVSTAQGDEERYEQLVRRFLERRVDALLCVHGHGEGQSVARYLTAGIPALALVTRAGGYEALPLVSDSIKLASADCVAALAAQGHRRVGVVMPGFPVHLVSDFLGAAGAMATPLTGTRDAGGRLDAAAVLAEVMAMKDRPTALVALRSEIVALLAAADAAGVAVPEALSLIAIRDRSPLTEMTRLPLSILHFDPSQMGARAADILKDWMDGKTSSTEDVRVETGAWLEKGTSGPAPRA